MKRALWIAAALLAAYLLFWPVPIRPVPFTATPNPGKTGSYAANSRLQGLTQIAVGIGPAPEDIAQGPDGFLYAGLDDGRVVRFQPDGGTVQTVAHTGGRPLGMKFDATGNLVVADAFRGLLQIVPGGAVKLLTDSVDDERLRFVNDLDIAADGVIWFSDSSRRFNQHAWMNDFLEGRHTGRLLTFDPRTGRTVVRLDNLAFANGVALGPDEQYVLVAETMAARITRLWLKGPHAGRSEVFIEGLPAYPDNLSYNGRGVFWIALPNPRVALLDALGPWPSLRKVLARIPQAWRDRLMRVSYGWLIGVDAEGRVVRNLQDPSGASGSITSVHEFDGTLYLGSIAMSSVGKFPIAPQ